MFEILAKILNTKELRGKILVTCLIVAIYRLGIFIPIPGIDVKAVDDLIAQTQSGGEGAGRVMAAINMFSGGALSKGAIFALGIMPYITASIVFQLLVAIVPSLARLQNEGATGRKKITQYTRLATLGLALLQSLFICGTLWSQSQGGSGIRLVSAGVAWYEFYFYGVLSLTTGTMFLMWLGEQVDEFGIGNGISIIILASIVSQMPGAIRMVGSQFGTESMQPWTLFVILVLFVAMTLAVVMITLGTRRVAIQQSKATRGRKVYGGVRQHLPLKVNQGGVIPIIFAQSLMFLPMMIFNWVDSNWNTGFTGYFNPGAFWYTLLYVTLIVFFCYFYTAITFNPKEMADNLKQSGMYIPGIRPGKRTEEHLSRIMTRIALAGAIFLSFVAIVPDFVNASLGVHYQISGMLGGTGLLIVVGVALDVVQRVESYLLMKDYEGFSPTGGRTRGRR